MVDSRGWLEVVSDGAAAAPYAAVLAEPEALLVPAVVLNKVYERLCLRAGEETALQCADFMQQATLAPLDATLTLEAADHSRKHRLAMVDALVYATAARRGAGRVTSDADLQGFPGAGSSRSSPGT